MPHPYKSCLLVAEAHRLGENQGEGSLKAKGMESLDQDLDQDQKQMTLKPGHCCLSGFLVYGF